MAPDGGPATYDRWKVQFFELNFGEEEDRAVASVLKSRWLTMGEKTKHFEEVFSQTVVDGALCTAVSSCTAALHMALLSLGVGPGDEVAIPALTFVADLNVVKLAGATPVLVDCESLDDWNVSAAGLREALGPRTKAVIIVHYAGYPCPMDQILSACGDRGVPLIEDVAHGPGATYKGKKLGTMGAVGCFSFFSNKNISVGEGGMFVTADKALHEKANLLRCHGMTTVTYDRFRGHAISYDVRQPGLNYRLDEIRAALGIVQTEKLYGANEQRRRLVLRYTELLKDVRELRIPFLAQMGGDNAFHIYPVLLGEGVDRLRVIESLKRAGIQTSIHYPAFSAFTAYKEFDPARTPVANAIAERVLTLPLHPRLSVDDVAFVAENLIRAVHG
jgi:dTDP-4-amino-4,6-dideoxygalactose transaminase